ncbi:BlaI/MecI/CopY family transcriptional regulator [Pleionea sediminis]|uniref:BlaI/MecI/CopY family transcriptional regulator n=1 Tax=Pleionea sediminis TaxID=2569479 RepID=UPI0011859FB4|nr:BlaI/MecI/CopY family transcriptional regulator [Pleionea sediminis]
MNIKKTPSEVLTKPSPTELALLKVLWRRFPLSAREIHNLVEQQLDWSYSSTRKTLERMTEKGFLKVEEVHGIRVFTPQVSKVKTLAGFIKDFTRSVLEVDGALPVAMFAESKLLDESELSELEQLLEQEVEHDDR